MMNIFNKVSLYVVSTILAVSFVVFAGTLAPSSNPADTMVSVDDLYRKAMDLNFLLSSSDYGYLSTTSAAAPSMHTLQDIWDVLDFYGTCLPRSL